MTRRAVFGGFTAAALALARHLSQVMKWNPIQINFLLNYLE